mmetsp:Transcript_7497/g.16230  ORF Transcript_7497/g.16230 Transcript_7497/m.16230 type:complete len:1444 (-) Transcript_7497:183-4514(-)
MARKSKKIVEVADDGDATEEESVRENDNTQMDLDDVIPSIVDKDSGDEDDDAVAAEEVKDGKEKTNDKKSKKKNKKNKKDNNEEAKEIIPFMDTFYLLSSEESPEERSIAARDLIRHCFLSGEGINHKDAAYALTRLMNGLCTGRAASRQGFASCLSSFLRVANSSSLNKGDVSAMDEILKDDDDAKKLKDGMEGDDAHHATIVRQKLLATTEFLASEGNNDNNNNKGQPKNRSVGKPKGIEERDHVFGRLFGILAVVRSGILGLKDFPSVVIEGYTKDLIELYHYKKWMKEPSAHALVELLSSLDTESNLNVITEIANDIITPEFFLHGPENGKSSTGTNRAQWLQKLGPEQIAVALHLQTLQNNDIKYDYPLNESLVTAESVPTLSAALSSTSSVVYPRCHFVWNTLWMYLTEKVESSGRRQLRTNKEFPSIIEKVIQHVVVELLLGKGESISTPTNERRSLALQIICALSGSSDLKIALPPNLISSVLCPDVVVRVFENVLCASGGLGKKRSNDGVEHYLKPLTSEAILDLVDHCCEDNDVSRRMAFAKAFTLAVPRFDTKTKTQTVSSLLMLSNVVREASEESEKVRKALWQSYLSFLEEEIVKSTSLHSATVYIELMYKLAKLDLTIAPADEGRRVLRFFMSGAFFDCSGLADPSVEKKTPSKKKKKVKTKAVIPTQELSSGLRIKEILETNEMTSISHPARAIMSARFYSLLSDFISAINSQNRGGSKDKAFYGKGSRPESIYRALSEISGIVSLLETSGAKQFPVRSGSMDTDENSEEEDPMETSRKCMLRVQKNANDALIKECDGAGDETMLRAKAVFATSCASLMTSLYLQLNSCGNPDADGNAEAEEDDDDVVESVHEYISDLAECVDGFCQLIDDESEAEKMDDEGNPLAEMAGLLVNILSSPVGGEDSGETNPIQASASKLTRETVKLTWSGIISVITDLNEENKSLKSLVDEDVMNILIESVCGEKSMGEKENIEDDESIAESESSDEELGGSAVFVDASEAGMDLDGAKDEDSNDLKESDEETSKDSKDKDGDEDVELDPAKLENLLLEDSDAEMSDSGVLEHHAGADKALAALIKLKQDARKASQTERERIELCNRLRCAVLLDSLFTQSVFKSGWLPIEAVLGSIVPILRSRRLIAKSIETSSSVNVKKSLSERKALLDRLTALVTGKISKFRCGDDSDAEEVALKASSDIYEEMKRSLNVDHCSCCSVALITVVRCIPGVEENSDIKDIYVGTVKDWSSRKATKIHACVFENLIQRMPSLASLILTEPLMVSARGAHSSFLKCESIKLVSSIYKHDGTKGEELLSKKAISSMKEYCNKFADTLTDALGDSSLQKSKHRDAVLTVTKHFINYVKSQDVGILTAEEIHALHNALKTVKANCRSVGMKKMCSHMSDTVTSLSKREAPKRTKPNKVPKSSKKQKKSKSRK